MADEPHARDILMQAGNHLLREARRPEPDWETVVLIAMGVVRAAGAELHEREPHVSDLEAETEELNSYDRELDEHTQLALEAVIENFEAVGAIVSRIVFIAEGYDAATTPFRTLLASPAEQPQDLANLAGNAYTRLTNAAAAEPSAN